MKQQSLYERAITHLARREHSAEELQQKLSKFDFQAQDIENVISQLSQSGMQSDSRLTENYVRYRSQRGCGPLRITQELKERGISSEMIDDNLKKLEIDWFTLAASERSKRFGEQGPEDFKERAKQQRFLQYRGFTHEQISESLKKHDEE